MNAGRHFPYVLLLRHLVVTLFIALAVLIFEQAGKLDWMDSVTFRMAAPLKGETRLPLTEKSQDLAQRFVPRVVLLDSELYEGYFQQEPYPSKDKLLSILQAVVKILSGNPGH